VDPKSIKTLTKIHQNPSKSIKKSIKDIKNPSNPSKSIKNPSKIHQKSIRSCIKECYKTQPKSIKIQGNPSKP